MRMKLYRKLAKENIKRNSETYFPYIIASVMAITLYFLCFNLSSNTGFDNIRGAAAVRIMFGFTSQIIAIISMIIILYSNSYLIKVRAKEFGLYSVLGLEKKHIALVMLFENLITSIAIIIISIIIGIIFNKLNFLIISNILGLDEILKASINFKAVLRTIILFSVEFLIVYVLNIYTINKKKTIDLLKAENKGEKEPKAKPVLAIVGILLLVVGYTMSIKLGIDMFEMDTLPKLFLAIILVIIATYLLFTFSSIWILKILKKNKNYYYKRNNFISLSNLIFRMKKNAMGLASICVLSCMVIVTLGTTTSVFIYSKQLIKEKPMTDMIVGYNPADVSFDEYIGKTDRPSAQRRYFTDSSDKQKSVINNTLNKLAEEKGIKVVEKDNFESFNVFIYNAQLTNDKNYIKLFTEENKEDKNKLNVNIAVFKLSEYNKINNLNEELYKDEMLIYKSEIFKKIYGKGNAEITTDNMDLKTKKELDKIPLNLDMQNENGIFLVLADETYNNLYKDLATYSMNAENAGKLEEDIGYQIYRRNAEYWDIEGSQEQKDEYIDSLINIDKENRVNLDINGKIKFVDRYMNELFINWGVLIFIGVYLGLSFTIAMMIIIYFKQISEGYEDRRQYQILQKVGLSNKEIKNTINKQVKLVFYLPIIGTICHILAASFGMQNLNFMMGIGSKKTYIVSMIISAVFYLVVYTITYKVTSYKYYQIVQREESILSELNR